MRALFAIFSLFLLLFSVGAGSGCMFAGKVIADGFAEDLNGRCVVCRDGQLVQTSKCDLERIILPPSGGPLPPSSAAVLESALF